MSNDFNRVVFLGPADAGKTSLIYKIVDNSFDSYRENTVIVDFKKFQYIHESHEIKLALWDTAGQERYRSLTKTYMRKSKFFILVCAIDDANSLDSLRSFIELIHQNSVVSSNIFLLCNKCDLDESQHQIDLPQLTAFQKSNDIDAAQFISAKSGEGISNFLDLIAKAIIDSSMPDEPETYSINLNERSNKKCCV